MIFYAWVRSVSVEGGTDGDGMPIERWETQVSPLTADEANAKKSILMVDVGSLGFEPYEGQLSGSIVFNGPLPPGSNFDVPGDDSDTSWVIWAQGGSTLPSSEGPDNGEEDISVNINWEWCEEKSVTGFVVEYDAAAEMLYTEDDFYGRPAMWMYSTDQARIIGMRAHSRATGLELYSFKIYAVDGSGPKAPDLLLLQLTIAPDSDGTLLESYEAHSLLSDWVASWPELGAYPGSYSPLQFMFEPSPNASFFMPITIEMITIPPEGPPPGASLDDFLYLRADMFPGFDPLSPNNYGIDESGGGASYYASLPAWELSEDPWILRPTVREIRIYSVGGGSNTVVPFWAELMGTTETL